MKIPFTHEKIYVSDLSYDEIFQNIEDLKSQKEKGFFSDSPKYDIEYSKDNFVIQDLSRMWVTSSTGRSIPRPEINGDFLSKSPPRLKIRVQPSRFWVLFMIIFQLTFIISGLFIRELKINGVVREPDFYERMLFSFGGVIPILIALFLIAFLPVKNSLKFITELLKLKEDQVSDFLISKN